MEILAWIGFTQGLFSAILMKTKRNPSIADKILTAWLTLLAIEFLTCAIDYKVFGAPLLSSSFLLFNPAVYLYIKSLTIPTFKLRWSQLLHLLPFLLFESVAYILIEPYSLHEFLKPDDTLWFRMLFTMANVLSWLYYNSLSILLFIKHRKRLVHEFSTIERNMRMVWLVVVLAVYNSYCIIAIIMGILAVFLEFDYFIPHLYNYASLLFMVYMLGFYGLRQRAIFSTIMPTVSKIEPNGKYIHSNIPKIKKAAIVDKLVARFESSKPYLNPELNVTMLAQQIGVPKHHLTEVLSTEIGKNFFQFVNEHRVNAVKTMLKDPKYDYSIEAIGYECGFNSKSTFFTVFKKITGQTPQEYRENLGADG